MVEEKEKKIAPSEEPMEPEVDLRVDPQNPPLQPGDLCDPGDCME